MVQEAYRQRFGGIARLYGQPALEIFRQAHVCVIGIGGVGTWSAEALGRSGIGEITLVDLDDICVTNSNRQIHALADTIGKSKVAVMAERLRQINPTCQVNEVEEFIDPDNLGDVLGDKTDYVIDAIDSVTAKAALLAWCKRRKIKVVTVGGAGGQVDPTRVQLADLAKTYQDPLAAKVRSMLRRNHGFSKNPKRKFGIDCVFSTEQLIYPWGDGSVCLQKPEGETSMKMDCASGFGAATFVTGTFGFVAVSRVLQKLADSAR